MRMFKRLCSTQLLLLPFYTYKLIQLFVWRNSTAILVKHVHLVLTVLVSPLVLGTLVLLALYYHAIELYLRWRHGKRFNGMLDGCDRIWTIKSTSRNIINAFYTIAATDDALQPNEMRRFFQERFARVARTHPRFSSVIELCAGLDYYLGVDIEMDACVRYMDGYTDSDGLLALVESMANASLPLADRFLWEIHVGRTPITWHDGGRVYPLLVRMHHSLGDGVSLVTLMTTHLLRDGVAVMRAKCNEYAAIMHQRRPQAPRRRSNRFASKRFAYPSLIEPERPHALHAGPLMGAKHMIFLVERPNDDYVRKVKRIKRAHNVAFADVVSSAISAAMNEFFATNNQLPPKNILAMYPYFLMSSDFDRLVRIGADNVPIVNLGNKFAMGFAKLPIDLHTVSNNNVAHDGGMDGQALTQRLQRVREANDRLKNSLDFAFCYWQMQMFAGLPRAIGTHLLLANDATLCMSNMPGNRTATLDNGHVITDTFIFANNFCDLGITATLFTYDERFRIGLLIDRLLMTNRDDAQRFGDNIFKYIDEMHKLSPADS